MLPEYYKFLAKEVDVVASDKDRVSTLNDHKAVVVHASVKLFDQTKRQTKVHISKEFLLKMLREIRVWGMDGEDVFHVCTENNKGIKVKIIGGKGKIYFH